MLLIDANAILRYTLSDNTDMANKVRELITKNKVAVRYEVWAEVAYVLSKVYALPRSEIADGMKVFLSNPNVETESVEALLFALEAYAGLNMDFVDCLLYGFKAAYGYGVFTFDRQLNSNLNKLN